MSSYLISTECVPYSVLVLPSFAIAMQSHATVGKFRWKLGLVTCSENGFERLSRRLFSPVVLVMENKFVASNSNGRVNSFNFTKFGLAVNCFDIVRQIVFEEYLKDRLQGRHEPLSSDWKTSITTTMTAMMPTLKDELLQEFEDYFSSGDLESGQETVTTARSCLNGKDFLTSPA